MDRVIDYIVLSEEYAPFLTDKVREKLSEGWQPLGAASCSISEDDNSKYTLFSQAMVKYAPRVDAIDGQELLERASPDVLMALCELSEAVGKEKLNQESVVAMVCAYFG